MSEMSVGLHCKKIILGIYYFRISFINKPQWLVVSNIEYNLRSPGSFPKEVYKNLFFNSDIKNFPLKTNGGETESLILSFFFFGVL